MRAAGQRRCSTPSTCGRKYCEKETRKSSRTRRQVLPDQPESREASDGRTDSVLDGAPATFEEMKKPLLLVLLFALGIGRMIREAWALLSLVLLLSACATTPNKTTIPNDTVSFVKDAWVFSFSPNMPAHLTSTATGWYFDFPSSDGVHYVRVPYHAAKSHQTLTITYRVTGTGKFISVDAPCRGAGFSPVLERAGDTMSAAQEWYRFWGKQILLVADGQIHTAVYRLDDSTAWTGVFGKSNGSELSTTEKNLMAVGLTYGGCFAGHGVYVEGGKIRFELLGFAIK